MPTYLPRVLSISDADRFGVTVGHIRTYVERGHWSRIAPGIVLTRPEPPGRADWLDVGLIAGGPGAAVSGVDALALHGLNVTPRASVALVLTRTAASRSIGPLRLRHTEHEYDVHRLGGTGTGLAVRTVSAARAVADAAVLGAGRSTVRGWVSDLVQAGICTPGDLAAACESGQRRGSAVLRAVIAELDEGARSVAEMHAARQLTLSGVPPFELNVPVVVDGVVIAVLDIFWRLLRAALEIDSRKHHAAPGAWERTMARHNRLTALGLAIRHDPPAAIGAQWCRQVEGWLRGRAVELGVPYRADARVIMPGPNGHQPYVPDLRRTP